MSLSIESVEHEVDPYSKFDGEPTDDFDLAGGSVVVRGTVDGRPVQATVSAANLPQALGHAVALLLRQSPGSWAKLVVVAYVDGETGKLTELDREETP